MYNFTFSCLKQGRPRKSSPFLPLRSHNFRWFRAPSLKCVKTQTNVAFLVFWIRPAWSSLEQGKNVQYFLLDRVAKFTPLCLEQGKGFLESAEPPTQIPVETKGGPTTALYVLYAGYAWCKVMTRRTPWERATRTICLEFHLYQATAFPVLCCRAARNSSCNHSQRPEYFFPI